MRRFHATAAVASLAVLLLAGPVHAAEPAPPDLAGHWVLDRGQSDDIAEKVKFAAGSQYVQGAPKWGSETLLPWGRNFDEDERLMLRDLLLEGLRVLDTMEVEQTPSEFRTIHGEDGLRVFPLTRKGTGTSVFTGEKLTRQATWKGNQLLLDAKSGKTKVKETLTLSPAGDRLTHDLHAEMDLLEHPLDLKLVYTRAGASPTP